MTILRGVEIISGPDGWQAAVSVERRARPGEITTAPGRCRDVYVCTGGTAGDAVEALVERVSRAERCQACTAPVETHGDCADCGHFEVTP